MKPRENPIFATVVWSLGLIISKNSVLPATLYGKTLCFEAIASGTAARASGEISEVSMGIVEIP